MPAYNSVFNQDDTAPLVENSFPLYPLRTKTRGPAQTLPFPDPPLPAHQAPDSESDSYDILDEVLYVFRANILFRNFEIQGNADRLLIYGILFVSEALGKIKPNQHYKDAQREVMNVALDTHFALPGEAGFPLSQMYTAPKSRQDAEILRQYLSQVRQELAIRLLARVYEEDQSRPSKWWLSFTKRKFMGKSL